MIENENKLTIGFTLEGTLGEKYYATTTEEVFNSLGETDVDVIGRQLNVFLKQCGYVRKYDNIFMEDVSDEEYDALADYLEELRSVNGGGDNG